MDVLSPPQELWPCLSLYQPWAWSVSHGPKRTENRGRHPVRYRGPLWLHAARRAAWSQAGQSSPLVRAAWEAAGYELPLTPDAPKIEFGAIVALVEVTGCHHWVQCQGTCSPWAVRDCWHIEFASAVRPLIRGMHRRGQRGRWHLTAGEQLNAWRLLGPARRPSC